MYWLVMVVACIPHKGWTTGIASPIVVPSEVQFADIRLKLTKAARKRIQEKVNQLRQAKKLFDQIVERTHLFFPFITATLAAENVPEDFKFQALHESMLIGDAVSSTNDIGFWQIHKVAALELKLSIDHPIDERMHLIQSTKAAARFLTSHYNYFNSWLVALLAYNRGRTGAIKLGVKKYIGAKVVWLDHTTDKYIIAVIATKLAFEEVAGKKQHATWQLRMYHQGHHGHKLRDLALHLRVEEKLLLEHNKWLKTTTIPHNTTCALIVPFCHTHQSIHPSPTLVLPQKLALTEQLPHTMREASKQKLPHANINYSHYLQSSKTFPVVALLNHPDRPRLIKANGILAIVAEAEDTISSLTKLVGITAKKFLAINDITDTDHLIPGHIYYCRGKRSRGSVHYHVVKSNESIWDIAQRYGIQQAALLEKNRLKKESFLKAGQILWLRFIRPKYIPVEYLKIKDP